MPEWGLGSLVWVVGGCGCVAVVGAAGWRVEQLGECGQYCGGCGWCVGVLSGVWYGVWFWVLGRVGGRV